MTELLVFKQRLCIECGPYIRRLRKAAETRDIVVREIDVDTPAGRQAAQQLQVKSVPSTFMLVDGRVKQACGWAMTSKAIEAWIDGD